jgi:hypothetical protein
MNSTRKRSGVFLWLAGAVVFYVLSVGPAVSFTLGSDWGDVVDVIWYPVIALDGTDAQPLYRAYLGLWGVHFPKPIGF